MATRAQRRAQRKARAEAKRSKDAATKAARRLIKRALAETARYSALHRLHARNQITYEQWQAGVRLQQDELGSRDTRVMDLDPDHIRIAGRGLPTKRLAAQVERLAALRDALGVLTATGKVPLNVTYAVCVGDADMPRVAKALGADEQTLLPELRTGLNALLWHYEGERRQAR